MLRVADGVLLLIFMVLQAAGIYLKKYFPDLSLVLRYAGAACVWAAAFFIFQRVSRSVRHQTLTIAGIGAVLIAVAVATGNGEGWFSGVVLGPMNMILLFVSVCFLRLMPHSKKNSDGTRVDSSVWYGRKGMFGSTVAGALLSSVLNVAAVIILGDRISDDGKRKLSPREAVILGRSLYTSTFWSPFFVATTVMMTLFPDMELAHTLPFGLGLSLVCLVLVYVYSALGKISDDERGYPLNFMSLVMPVSLMILVFAGHFLLPKIPVVAVTAVVCPLAGLLLMPKKGMSAGDVVKKGAGCIQIDNVLMLYLGVAVLAEGAGLVLRAWPPVFIGDLLSHYGVVAAMLMVMLMTALSSLGVHQLITISATAPVILTVFPEVSHSFLALSYLTGWGVSGAFSPFSAANLLATGRYGVEAGMIFRSNLLYLPALLIAAAAQFLLYSMYFGLPL